MIKCYYAIQSELGYEIFTFPSEEAMHNYIKVWEARDVEDPVFFEKGKRVSCFYKMLLDAVELNGRTLWYNQDKRGKVTFTEIN